MNKIKRILTLCMGASFALCIRAGIQDVANVPDSVSLFSYARADGGGGLQFAWSTDGNRWFAVGNGYVYLTSDFGPWGRGKKMYNPQLLQSRTDGSWHCIWESTTTKQTYSHAASADLLTWGAQEYFKAADKNRFLPAGGAYPVEKTAVTVGGTVCQGYVQRVPYAVVERLDRYADHRRYRWQLIDERMEQDPARFAGLQTVHADIQADVTGGKAISDHLIGIFFEDINYGADGGLYAEMVQNRDFEYALTDGSPARWTGGYAWTVKEGDASRPVVLDTKDPIHPNNLHYVVLDVQGKGVALCNSGWDGMALKKGERYDFSLFGRVAQGSRGGKLAVRLLDGNGREVAEATVTVSSDKWKKRTATLTANVDVEAAVLSLEPLSAGTYHLDMISLFPRNTFKGRKNGLRADLAQALADLHPRFIRFPGGCVAHGDGVDNIYHWKESIGSLEERKPLRNLWGYHQTRGLGYFEFFQFCEDIGAEPVPVVAAGVPCQNSGTPSAHSVDEITSYGQQGGIPQDKMPQYVQDVLNLIEYANGDARTTVWGKKRAKAGHPEPFGLKFIGIGNEDIITPLFERNFNMIYQAVRQKYPDITVIGTVGPFYEGTDYNEGWKLASKYRIPMVDEHYYVAPGWLINNQNYYDRYDRNKSKVYLGEYAAHLPGRPNNMETALSEALYLTAVERNADVVTMTSYAPLLAKEGHTQWNPDLIYFNNTEVKLTTDYYVQQMYGQNSGDSYIPSAVKLDNAREDVNKRVGVSVVRDSRSGDYIVKLANLLPVQVSAKVALKGAVLVAPKAVKTVLCGTPADKTARPVTSDFGLSGTDFGYDMPAYSFTVIRISDGGNRK